MLRSKREIIGTSIFSEQHKILMRFRRNDTSDNVYKLGTYTDDV